MAKSRNFGTIQKTLVRLRGVALLCQRINKCHLGSVERWRITKVKGRLCGAVFDVIRQEFF